MFIIILWLLLHAKRNYRKRKREKKKKKQVHRQMEGGEREGERNVTPAISAGLSNDIIILYRYTHNTYTRIYKKNVHFD